MSLFHSPSIVRDGLQLYLDAANPKSYPGSGATWFDLSGNGRNFTGDASYISSQNGIRSGVTWSCPSSLIGNILNTDYHSIFFSIRFNSTETFPESWTGSFNKIFEHNGSSGDRSPGIWRYPNNRTIHWRYNPNNTGADFGPTSSSGNFAKDSWFIIGLTKDGSNAKSYVNSSNVVTSTVSFPKQTGSSNINLFPSYPENLANIEHLMIFDKTLSEQEIKQNFNALRGRYGI
jgi:hypothetical protein